MFGLTFMDVRTSVTVFAVCLVQLLGAALLGWAVAIWAARGTLLGGIYGRAIVAGNHMHLTVGAVLLVTHGVNAGVAHPAYFALAAFYVLGALFFSYLTFFSSGLRKPYGAQAGHHWRCATEVAPYRCVSG